MSEQNDSEKTEEPTEKRLEEAHKKGDVARSQELRHFFMLGGSALAIGFFSTSLAQNISQDLSVYFELGDAFPMDAANVLRIWKTTSQHVFLFLLAPLLLLLIAGLAGTLMQQRPVWAVEKLMPKFSKLSLIKGFGRMFSLQAVADLGKNIFKLVLVGVIIFLLVWPGRDRLDVMMQYDLMAMLAYLQSLTLKMFMAAAAAMAVLGGADYFYQRFDFLKKQRMTRQEVKDEHKQSEGDPMIKARVRQIRRERARSRMMAAVPEATVVIVNPTHYAVALKYEHQQMAAPKCVAKGVDNLALRIRALAEENQVPVLENPSLARTLYAAVEIDAEISTEHYKAVAEVISFVMRLKAKKTYRRAIQARS